MLEIRVSQPTNKAGKLRPFKTLACYRVNVVTGQAIWQAVTTENENGNRVSVVNAETERAYRDVVSAWRDKGMPGSHGVCVAKVGRDGQVTLAGPLARKVKGTKELASVDAESADEINAEIARLQALLPSNEQARRKAHKSSVA